MSPAGELKMKGLVVPVEHGGEAHVGLGVQGLEVVEPVPEQIFAGLGGLGEMPPATRLRASSASCSVQLRAALSMRP